MVCLEFLSCHVCYFPRHFYDQYFVHLNNCISEPGYNIYWKTQLRIAARFWLGHVLDVWWGIDFSLRQSDRAGSGVHRASCSMGFRAAFPRGVVAGSWNQPLISSEAESKKSMWSYTFSLPSTLMSGTNTGLIFCHNLFVQVYPSTLTPASRFHSSSMRHYIVLP